MMIICIACTRVLVGGFYVTCLIQDISRIMFWIAYTFDIVIQLVWFIGGVSTMFFFSIGIGICDMRIRSVNEYSIGYVYLPGYAVGVVIKVVPVVGMPIAVVYFLLLKSIILSNIFKSLNCIEFEGQDLILMRRKIYKDFRAWCICYCHVNLIYYFVCAVCEVLGKNNEIFRVFFGVAEGIIIALIAWVIRPRRQLIFNYDLLFDSTEMRTNMIKFFKADSNSSYKEIYNEGVLVTFQGPAKSIALAKPL